MHDAFLVADGVRPAFLLDLVERDVRPACRRVADVREEVVVLSDCAEAEAAEQDSDAAISFRHEQVPCFKRSFFRT